MAEPYFYIYDSAVPDFDLPPQQPLKPKKEEKKPEVENQFVYTNLEEQMKSLIGTKVSVHAKANGKGKIEIEYYSPDDLERIYELLMTIQHN